MEGGWISRCLERARALVPRTADTVWSGASGSSRSGSLSHDRYAMDLFKRLRGFGSDLRGPYRYLSHGHGAWPVAVESGKPVFS